MTREWKYPPTEIISTIKENTDDFSVTYSKFFKTILQSIETKGWVDIENDYYQLLKQCTGNAGRGYSVKELNEQLAYLQEKLVEYLRTIDVPVTIETINSAIRENICIEDLSIEGKALAKTMGVIEYDTNAFDDN